MHKIFQRISLLCSAATLVAGTAQAQNVVIDRNFGAAGLSAGGASRILVRYRPVVIDDQVYICGGFAMGGTSTDRRFARAIIRDAELTMNGQVLMRNMGFFSFVSSGYLNDGLVGQTANCQATGQSVSAAPLSAYEVELRAGNYRISR